MHSMRGRVCDGCKQILSTKYFFVVHLTKAMEISVTKISFSENITNIMTKAFGYSLFDKYCYVIKKLYDV
jgi:hypothetical protein